MTTVTVAGGNGETYRLNYSAQPSAAVNELSSVIRAQVLNIRQRVVPYHAGQKPTTPAGLAVFSGMHNAVSLGPTERIVLVTGEGPNTIAGSGATDQLVLSDDGDLTYFTGGGSGRIATGNGRNVIGSRDGTFNIATGAGDDTILALGGVVTATGGAGRNVMFTGTGRTNYKARGNDSVLGVGDVRGLGADTIEVESNQSLRIAHNANALTFVNGGGSSTVYGGFGSAGTGSATVYGGKGGGIFQGGKLGGNMLIGQQGTVTLFGGGEGDVLRVEGAGTYLLAAGLGNETLIGAANSGGSYYFAGKAAEGRGANTRISAGNGADTVIAGTGNATVDAGLGADLFVFVNDQAGGNVVIDNFRPGEGDRVLLVSYGEGETDQALSGSRVIGGSVEITLSDKTRITFTGLPSASRDLFI